MKKIRFLKCLFIPMLLCLEVQAQDPPSIPLPEDPSLPVITADWTGGFPPPGTKPRRTSYPVLSIQADGGVTIAESNEVKGKLMSAELQELLRFAINENSFFQITERAALDGLRAEQMRCGRFYTMIDTPTTVIRIRTATTDHEVRFEALHFYSRHYSMVKPIVQLRAIEKRLVHLMAFVRVGSTDGVASALAIVNEHLKTRTVPGDPKPLPALTARDLSGITEAASGTRRYSFTRDLENNVTLGISVEQSQTEDPKVTLSFVETVFPLDCPNGQR